MYAHIVSFEIKDGEDTTFLEMQKFEENVDAKPNGLDHFHIFKDLNSPHVYHLVEYWENQEAREAFEKTEDHQAFHKNRAYVISKKFNVHNCDVLV